MSSFNTFRTGTNHFETIGAAMAYYSADLGVTKTSQSKKLRRYVHQKLEAKEIAIGRPVLSPGQRCYLDRDRRYWVTN